MFRHSIKKCAQPSPLSFFRFSIKMLFLSFLLTSFTPSFAEQSYTPIQYGPIKKGQSLWEIAEETLPNKSVTIEQLVFSLYDTNQKAFQSGNMNLLKAGSYITIPNIETIQKVSPIAAKKQLSQHVHALNLLRVDAKQLKKAEKKTSRYSKQVKRIQKRLAKYKYESHAWNRTYKSLVKGKKRFRKSKNNAKNLRKLLLEKATLKFSPNKIVNIKAPSEIKGLTTQIDQIKDDVESLQSTQNDLSSKVKNIKTMKQRIVVLEDELGSTDTLVSKLKSTVNDLQENINEQVSVTKQLQENIDEIKIEKSTSKINNTTDTSQEQALNEEEAKGENSTDNQILQPTGENNKVTQERSQVFEELTETFEEAKSETIQDQQTPNINEVNNNQTSDPEALRITLTPVEQEAFEFIKQVQLAQPSPVTPKQDNSSLEYNSNKIKHATFSQVEPKEKTPTFISEPNPIKHMTFKVEKSDSQPQYFSQLIIIGSILNGLILIFVLFKLIFIRKKKPISV